MSVKLSTLFVCFVLFGVSDAAAQLPEEGKFYHVRSAQNGFYLESTSIGDLCDVLSEVLVRDYENSTAVPREATWFVSDYWEAVGGWRFFDQIGLPLEYHYNSVTYISYGYTEFPPCTPINRFSDFISVDGGVNILATENGTCLSHKGTEKAFVFWSECNDPTVSQTWILEETELKK